MTELDVAAGGKMSEPLLRALAVSDPRTLIACLREMTLSPGLLSRAAEALGLVRDHSVAVPLLVELLHHHDPVVQEGAIYGLSSHLSDEVRAHLATVAASTAVQPMIREIAQEVLTDDAPSQPSSPPSAPSSHAEREVAPSTSGSR